MTNSYVINNAMKTLVCWCAGTGRLCPRTFDSWLLLVRAEFLGPVEPAGRSSRVYRVFHFVSNLLDFLIGLYVQWVLFETMVAENANSLNKGLQSTFFVADLVKDKPRVEEDFSALDSLIFPLLVN